MPESVPALPELLDRVERVRPVVEAHRAWNEQNRRLSDEVYDAMLSAGLFRMTVPKAFGGYELHPLDTLRVIFELAKIDSAAGWNLMIGASGSEMAALAPPQAAETLYAHGPDVICAGALHPPARATRTDGGWRVTGRTPFASGCHRAHWFGMLCFEAGSDGKAARDVTGAPVVFVAFFPASEGRIIETWNPTGMRGTGSCDIAADDVFVPDHMVRLSKGTPAPAFNGPLYATPGYAPTGQATVCLAVAESAVEALVGLAITKIPALAGRSLLAERETAQHHLGRARTLVEAGKSFLTSSVAAAYEEARSAEGTTRQRKKQIQMAVCFAAESAAQAVDLVCEAAGTSGFNADLEFDRHFRDVHTLAQHASHSSQRYVSLGKVELGKPGDIPLLMD